ncbi:hypothetical protein DFAR_3760013 [Desulfarculales bacterium]
MTGVWQVVQGSRLPRIDLASPQFFQYHSYIIARVPRVSCHDSGTKQVTLLFEQAAMTLVQEMPVLAAARIIGVSDTRFWPGSSST